jgi:hypothetical protein
MESHVKCMGEKILIPFINPRDKGFMLGIQ